MDDQPVPSPGTSDERYAMASAIIDLLAAWTPSRFSEGTELERVEVIDVEGEPGVMMLWTQETVDRGLRRFMRIETVSALADVAVNPTADGQTPQGLASTLFDSLDEPQTATGPASSPHAFGTALDASRGRWRQ